MKILYRDDKIVGTAANMYTGPETFVTVEDGFDLSSLDSYEIVEGGLVAKSLVPLSITPRQGYIILSRYGLLAPVKAYFAGLEGQAGEEAQIELEYAQEWKRTWPILISAATSFGLTDAQIDTMFIEASTL